MVANKCVTFRLTDCRILPAGEGTAMAMKRTVKRSADADSIMLIEAFEDFIIEKEAHNLAPSTLTNYRQSFDYFKKFAGYDDKTTTDEINKQAIYQWINTLKLNGVKHSCMDGDRKYIDPAFKIQLIEGQEETIKLFSDEELEALLVKPRKKDSFAEWRTWAIVNWVLATGNRAATICEVKIDHVNFAKKEIQLSHTKNKKAQYIPLSSSLETALKEYIRMWRKEAPIDGWMFPNVGEEKLTTNALRLSFGRYCTNRGIEKSNIHGLRHNFAKGWLRNNGNMFVLQKILGHSTLDMTRRYVKLFSEDIKEDYDKFSPLDSIKRGSKRTRKVERS